ncbi:MAG TPA: ABC transporter ATP-binding protein [Gaiellaceae bacterium]|nr:ABC transporter ATP-binding protein [Gaiellaceae bacterium]
MRTSSEQAFATVGGQIGYYAVSAEHLTKSYELGELASLHRTISTVANRVLNRGDPPRGYAAVNDVTFTIEPGECFALIGANGSGKTTLSRIIAGITLPTAGVVHIRGRVLPLLNVAAAFHPELNGRENVELFGTILGLDPDEIAAVTPEIAAFSGIDRDHLATPTKQFSEGMQARLAFAIALRLPAEVYIFDEVLVVADTAFKAACVAEIKALADRGRTVIFISHELPLVRSICTRGMWIDRGRVRMIAPIDDLLDAYVESREPDEAAGVDDAARAEPG